MKKEPLFQKIDNKENFDFDEYLTLNQFGNTSILERFLKDIYRELSTSIEGITLDTFREFISLPSYISDKIFNVFNKNNKKNLGLNEFLSGMTSLYNGDFIQLTKFIFDFYDFDKDQKIIYEDVKQIQLLILPSEHHKDEIFECINDSLDSFFEDYKYMIYDNFVYITENYNSDIFMNLVIYFYANKPFTNEILNYYQSDKRLIAENTKKFNSYTPYKDKDNLNCTEIDDSKRNIFSISKENDQLMIMNSSNNKKNTKLNSKNFIKAPKNNLYLQGISQNFSRMVTYTEKEPQNVDDFQNFIIKEESNSENEDNDIYEEAGEEYDRSKKINIPEMPLIKTLFNANSSFTRDSDSTNYEKNSDDIVVIKSHSDNDIKIDALEKSERNNNSEIFNQNLVIQAPLIENKKKVASKFFRSYTFTYDKSNFSNKKEENTKELLDPFQNQDNIILKQKRKITYENFINKFHEKKEKIIKYYIILNYKLMLYFKNESKTEYRGLHYLSDNYSNLIYDKSKTININGVKHHYLNLIIKNSKKCFVSQNEFELRKWAELLKKTINPYKSRILKDFFTIKESICEGKYGVVKRGINRKNKNLVSIKVINRNNLSSEKKYDLITKEIEILRHCNHKSILKYIDHFEEVDEIQKKNNVYIVMEYLSGGDLAAYIHKNGALHEKKVVSLAWDIAKGIEYLHKLGIIHRDIKPENIVFDNIYKPRIVDFGLSQIISCYEFLTESYGTYLYASPEIHNKWKYNKSTDIWSFGILIYYILTADLPFDKNRDVAHLTIKDLDEELEFSNINFMNSSEDLQDLIKNCLKKDVNARFNINQVVVHNLFTKFNFKNK